MELWFHIIIWCHPKTVTPGRAVPLAMPLGLDGRNFPAIKFADKKSPDLAFSNVDRYKKGEGASASLTPPLAKHLENLNQKCKLNHCI